MASMLVQGGSEIRQLIDKLEDLQLTLKKYIKTAGERLQVTTIRFKDLKDEVKRKGEQCKEDIDMIVTEYVSLCDKLERESEDLLTGHISSLEERYGTSVEIILDCNQALKSGQSVQLSGQPLDIPLEMPQLPSIQFESCLDSTDRLKEALGTLTTDNTTNKNSTQQDQAKPKAGFLADKTDVSSNSIEQLLDEPCILTEFKCPGRVSSICPSPGGQAWTRHAQTLSLIDKVGQVKHKVECSDCVTDISLSPTTHKLWLCTWGRKVMTCDPSSLTEMFTTDSVPWCLCVTNTNHIVVGMKHKVTMFNSQGQIVHTTSTKETGIVRPERISQCPMTGNIALVDTDNKSNSLILDKRLKVIHNHIGGGATASSIRPVDLVYDSCGNLVLADADNKSLELVTGEGDYLQTIHVLTGPVKALGVNNENVLWVAVYNKQKDCYQVQVLRYYNNSK